MPLVNGLGSIQLVGSSVPRLMVVHEVLLILTHLYCPIGHYNIKQYNGQSTLFDNAKCDIRPKMLPQLGRCVFWQASLYRADGLYVLGPVALRLLQLHSYGNITSKFD